MSEASARAIHKTSVITGAIAVVLSPIPLADEIVFLPIYAVLTSRIAKHRGVPPTDVPWKPIMTTAIAALAARAVVNVGVSYIPGVAAALNAVTAAAVTEIFGAYVEGVYDDPKAAKPLNMKDIGERLKKIVAERMPKKKASAEVAAQPA
jgi:uncharacterized protein (DUF697 family)